jgi:hypothetical protein
VALRERLDTQPAAVKVKAQVMDDFNKALGAFKSAIDARQAGEAKVSQARAAESGARERFVSAYDSNIGAIRQMFPRDRAQQDLHFDEIAPSHAPAGGGSGDAPTPFATATDTKTK